MKVLLLCESYYPLKYIEQCFAVIANAALIFSMFLVLAGQGYVHFEASFRTSDMAVNSIASPTIDGRFREDFSIRFYVSQHGAGLDTLSKLHFSLLISLIISCLHTDVSSHTGRRT